MPRTAAITVLLIAVLAAIPGAHAAAPCGNRVVNGDAEMGPAASGFTSEKPVPTGWSQTSNATAVPYSSSDAPPPGPTGGKYLFAGGDNNAQSSLQQTVDLASIAADVDAGGLTATLSARLGGFQDQADSAQVTFTFRDSADNPKSTVTLGPVLPAERGNATSLVAKSMTVPVPAGTRVVDVVLVFNRAGGIYNDGTADDISLVLSPCKDPSAPPPPTPMNPTPSNPTPSTPTGPKPPAFGPTGVVQGLPSPKKCLSRRHFTIHIQRRRGRRYASVSIFLNGKRIVARKGRRVSGDIDLRGFVKGVYVVKIVVITTTGEVIQGKRRYHTCSRRRFNPNSPNL